MKITLPLTFSLLLLPCILLALHACNPASRTEVNEVGVSPEEGAAPADAGVEPLATVQPGIYSMPHILDLIGDRAVAVTSNHTGVINGVHLVDTLLASGVEVISVFAPEHGFRGDRPDGEKIRTEVDPKTNLPIISLYGSNKKPTDDRLKGVELMVFDIQDVGARFYTYLSTLHYVMEACAENGVPVVVLDRPNPNIGYVDGPVLDPRFSSFVGMHPVPVVYGMTIGEYARMINGEGWLKGGVEADLHVVECTGYTRDTQYELPVAPSPNLPNMTAIHLYPSLCFFEATTVSVGRGTPHPFSIIGEPSNRSGDYTFTPHPVPGASMHPKHRGELCRGYDLSREVAEPAKLDRVDLSWLLRMYEETGDSTGFFDRPGFFDKLAGTDALRKAVIAGRSEAEIRDDWREDIEEFGEIREKYLIYP